MTTMQAAVLDGARTPLQFRDIPVADPGDGQVLVRIAACGVCRTDLHVVDGELDEPKLPLVPGHEIVGVVEATGQHVESPRVGDRVGIPWLGWTCGRCEWCLGGRENLCPDARFTGYDIDGGFAEFTLADARYCVPLPSGADAATLAPLLCAGLIGYRAYRAAGDGECLGLYGFGAAAHILAQIALAEGRRVYAFTRPGDLAAQAFARELGATWAGDSDRQAPEPLHAAIIFAPVGSLVPLALASTRPAGVVVCAGIHMSEIPAFGYELLWRERVIRSVANLTRQDGREFMKLVDRIPIHTHIHRYPLQEANVALDDLRHGTFQGAAVLLP